MKISMYSIYDKKVTMYLPPFYARTDGEALRHARDFIVDAGSPLGKHAEDYDLFHVGYFDDESGLVGDSPNNFLVNLASLRDAG